MNGISTIAASAVRPPHGPAPPRRWYARLSAPLFARRGTWALVDQAVVSLASFLTTVIIARWCGPAELGIYLLAMSTIMMAMAVPRGLVWSPYTVYAPRLGGRRRATYRGTSLLHQASLSAVLAVVAGACMWGVPTATAGLAAVLALAVPALQMKEWSRRVAFAELRLPRALAIDSAAAAIQLALLLVIFWLGGLSATTALAAVAMACGASSLAAIWSLRAQYAFDRDSVGAEWRRSWHLGRWVLASQLVATAGLYTIPWLIMLLGGATATGLYAGCSGLVLLANPVVLGLWNLMGPLAAREYADGRWPRLRAVLLPFAAIMGLLVGGFTLVLVASGEFWMVLLYGQRFAGCWPVVTLLAIGNLAGALGMIAQAGLWAMERTDMTFRANLATFLIVCGLCAALMGPYGLLGAAIASMTASLVGAGAKYACLLLLARSSSADHEPTSPAAVS